MAKVITVFNQKGGCGKSMAAMQLGGSFAIKGLRTLIVDMDPQGTALAWSRITPNPAFRLKASGFPATVENLAPLGRRVVGPIEDAFDRYDVIMIDTPPAVESEAPWAALQISDMAIVPFIPTPADSWAWEARTLSQKAKQENPELIGAFHLASVYRRGATMEGILEGYREDLEIEMLKTVINQRNAYLLSQSCGLCVNQLPRSKAADAIAEIDALTDEVAVLLGLDVSGKGTK